MLHLALLFLFQLLKEVSDGFKSLLHHENVSRLQSDFLDEEGVGLCFRGELDLFCHSGAGHMKVDAQIRHLILGVYRSIFDSQDVERNKQLRPTLVAERNEDRIFGLINE